MDQKIYYNHSDYVGGMKEDATLKEMLAKKPEKVIELAVKGNASKRTFRKSNEQETFRICRI